MSSNVAKKHAFAQAANSRRARDWDAFLREQREGDLRWVLSTEQGRRFLYELLNSSAGVFGRVFTGNSETFHKEGRRAVGVELLERIQRLEPEAYVLMVQEAMRAVRETQAIKQDAPASAETDL